MTLKLFYKLFAAAISGYALTVIVWPEALFALMDDISAQANGAYIRISFYVLVVWMLVTICALMRTRPFLSDWPAPMPLWLGAIWFAQCVSYTGLEHGWFEFRDIIYEEDGVFETATAVVLLICVGFLIVAGVQRAWPKNRPLACSMFFMALVCIFLFLEEISWGQRIFGWETPDHLGEINKQSETNLHNIFSGYNQFIRLCIALLISSALIGRQTFMGWLDRLRLAPLMPPHAAIYFVPFLIYAHTYDELFEEVVVVFLAVYAVNLYRRLESEGRSPG